MQLNKNSEDSIPLKGRLFVVSGPSGAGKGTLVSAALEMLPNLTLSVSATTRNPRPGEVEGVNYHFKSDQEFDELISTDGLLEWARVHQHRYGTLKDQVNRALSEGQDLILEIDLQGYRQIRDHDNEVISVFVAPPTLEELERRLVHRGTESKESIEQRLCTARVEMEAKDSYTVVIVNDDYETAAKELVDFIDENKTKEQ
ncbi:MAG: guanylate kinase [Coriobacteriia bacterium]|nr:guanylate kinase [Coriobacteriia bacterium]